MYEGTEEATEDRVRRYIAAHYRHTDGNDLTPEQITGMIEKHRVDLDAGDYTYHVGDLIAEREAAWVTFRKRERTSGEPLPLERTHDGSCWLNLPAGGALLIYTYDGGSSFQVFLYPDAEDAKRVFDERVQDSQEQTQEHRLADTRKWPTEELQRQVDMANHNRHRPCGDCFWCAARTVVEERDNPRVWVTKSGPG